MKTLTCEQCGQAFAMSSGFRVFDRTLCEPCADREVATRGADKIPPGSLLGLTDPTICGRCGADFGSMELPRVGGLSLCHPCEEIVRNRPFPAWLPMALAVLVALAGFTFWRNQRFLTGYVALVRASQAFRKADLDAAAKSMAAASRAVPEARDVAGMAAFFRGLQLLREDKSAEAVAELTRAKQAFPSEKTLDRVLLSAQAGAAFDARDYELFLEREQQLQRLDPTDAVAEAGVASAFACRYAVSGDPALKAQALAHLERAAGMVKGDPERFREYERRIRHRLETREIISRQEYERRFPRGR